jgi:Peptidase C10 family/Spi protease inhibitor
MKKYILLSTLGFFLISAVLFIACSKTENPKNNLSSSNMKYLVPEDFVSKFAQNIPKIDEKATREIREVNNIVTLKDDFNNPVLYVINYKNNSGFVVISADFRFQPLCANVPNGNFKEDVVPSMLINWFDVTINQILAIRNNDFNNGDKGKNAWIDFIQNINPELNPEINGFMILDGSFHPNPCTPSYYLTAGPLLPVTWGQQCSYNDLCPVQSCTTSTCTNRVPTGCVATAMAQIIRKHNKVSSQNYNYTTMPNGSGNSEVQRLMHDAGVSINMNYQCAGSGAFMNDAKCQFINTFSFSNATHSSSYDINSDDAIVMIDIDNNKPVILSGCVEFENHKNWFYKWTTYSKCHAWVCDGYILRGNACYSSTLLHMNWGWHETNFAPDYVGYYAVNKMQPLPGYNFQYANEFIHNITP